MRQRKQVKPSTRPIATWVANRLQALYEHNRVPETWGSPSVSRPTFALWRAEGFWAAGSYLLQKVRETGRPDLSPVEKVMALVAGVALVTLANKGLRAEQKPAMTVGTVRRFSPTAPTIPVVFYILGAALLVAGSGGSSSGDDGGGDYLYPGSDTSTEYRVYGQPDQEDGRRTLDDPDDFDDFDV